MKQPVFLRIYHNGKLEEVKQFTDDQIVIGRNKEIQVTLAGEGISPLHAVIDERDSGYYVSDLGSKLGTFKNGQKVFDEALQSGDELQIGPYKIEFFVGVPKPTQQPPVQGAATEISPPPPPSKDKKAKPGTIKDSVVVTSAKTSGKGTYAPPSANGDLVKSLKNSRGPVVEVVVAWKERVLGSYHFEEKGDVTIGTTEDCSIVLPLLGLTRPSFTLLKLDSIVKVYLTSDMTGDYYAGSEEMSLAEFKRKNRLQQAESGFVFDLNQGEMIRLGLHGDLLNIYIRYVEQTPAPAVGPILDLSTSESTAVLMAIVIATLMGLYMMIYSPQPLEDESKIEEPIRKVVITFNPPKKQEIVEVKEESVPEEKKVVKVDMKKTQTTTKQDPGKAAALRPSPQNKKTNIVSSAVQQGGTINTGKPAANAKSETKDVSKLGLLSTFGGKGAQSQLSKAYSGTGELLGDAAKATGNTGSAEDRAGENLGGRLKNVGAGGKGTATYGISGVGTQGKGTGSFGTGTGGIGKKGKVDLNIGESEAEFTGSIDREAIRRVIRENKNQFQFCYNQALRKNSDAYGKIEIKWHIEERGRATNTVVKSNTVGDKQMGECIARVIHGLTFPEPPPDQIAEVIYPFVFTSQ